MSAPLHIGFVLLPDFTMLALAAFLDTLRLAADEGDRSRPIDCRWTVLSEDGGSVRASNGVMLKPDAALGDPAAYDYVVVVGGTLHDGQRVGDATIAWLGRAATDKVPLIGICTGGFALARAGLMRGRRCCVSWFHRAEFEAEFPDIEVVADRLFTVDRDRITCAGGTSVIHLASWLIDRHFGAGRSDKGLRIMIERARDPAAAQPLPPLPGLDAVSDNRVRRAMLLIERRLCEPGGLIEVASAVAMTPRHLARLFHRETGQSPSAFRDMLRIERARRLLAETRLPMTEIALRCGYADGAHFARAWRARHGRAPSAERLASASSPA